MDKIYEITKNEMNTYFAAIATIMVFAALSHWQAWGWLLALAGTSAFMMAFNSWLYRMSPLKHAYIILALLIVFFLITTLDQLYIQIIVWITIAVFVGISTKNNLKEASIILDDLVFALGTFIVIAGVGLLLSLIAKEQTWLLYVFGWPLWAGVVGDQKQGDTDGRNE